MESEDTPATDPAERVLILNPASGDGGHAAAIRERATEAGYAVRETTRPGDAVEFAREAGAAGVPLVAVAGGDGTLNEVVRGVDRAAALDRVTVGVIPTGTGNNFAGNVGVSSVDEGFDVLERGDRRRIDLGRANDRVFVNSCVGGLTADASGETSSELKARLGVMAYVITTLRSAATFEGLRLSIRAGTDGDRTRAWSGEAVCVLVGNGRRFSAEGDGQADMEDGRFDVTVVEDVSAADLLGDAVVERLLGGDASHVTRLQSPTLEIEGHDPDPPRFSLDGEMIEAATLSLEVRPRTLRIAVGERYDPDPPG